MAQKPVVVYLGGEPDSLDAANYERDGFLCFLRTACGCDAVLFEDLQDFNREADRLKRLLENGVAIACIVQQFHDVDYDQHTPFIKKVRSLSKDVPIVVIPHERHAPYGGDPQNEIFAYHHADPKLAELVRAAAGSWKPRDGWFGAETKHEQSLLFEDLAAAHQRRLSESGEDEDDYADPNTAAVSQAIRLRLLPSELFASEYEDLLRPMKFRNFKPVPVVQYDAEIRKAGALSPDAREALRKAIDKEECNTSGRAKSGYAIDSVSLEEEITFGMGEHFLARVNLGMRMCFALSLGDEKAFYDDSFYPSGHDTRSESCLDGRFLVEGLITPEVPGFAVPILMLYVENVDPEAVRKIACHIRAERRFIPLDENANLLG